MTWSVPEVPGACGAAKDTSGMYQLLGPGGDWGEELIMLLGFDPADILGKSKITLMAGCQ